LSQFLNNMHRARAHITAAGVLALITALAPAMALAATPAEAQQLKSTLTPFGAEKAGNKDGTIPAWTSGLTTPTPGFVNGGKRPDPFAAEKPLFSITAKNMGEHADKLSDGVKAMFNRYPETYRLDVYPTHRTAAAPQWVYDATYRNATQAKIAEGAAGPYPEGASGGIPFPIPKTGVEVVWNHNLRWRPTSFVIDGQGYTVSADGRKTQFVDYSIDYLLPYYKVEDAAKKFSGDYVTVRVLYNGPPIRAGEGIVARFGLSEDDSAWVYLTGQRRVRKLPNACCDTPNPAAAGVQGFDDVEVFIGRTDRFDWKLVGKKELFIPYNSNRSMAVPADALLGAHHLNPDHVRWELHRVWVVEATRRAGQRHQVARSLYYFDEDTWMAVLGDRWDDKGSLWKSNWLLPMVMPDVPAVISSGFGGYDLNANLYMATSLANDKRSQYRTAPVPSDKVFTPDGLINASVR